MRNCLKWSARWCRFISLPWLCFLLFYFSWYSDRRETPLHVARVNASGFREPYASYHRFNYKLCRADTANKRLFLCNPENAPDFSNVYHNPIVLSLQMKFWAMGAWTLMKDFNTTIRPKTWCMTLDDPDNLAVGSQELKLEEFSEDEVNHKVYQVTKKCAQWFPFDPDSNGEYPGRRVALISGFTRNTWGRWIGQGENGKLIIVKTQDKRIVTFYMDVDSGSSNQGIFHIVLSSASIVITIGFLLIVSSDQSEMEELLDLMYRFLLSPRGRRNSAIFLLENIGIF